MSRVLSFYSNTVRFTRLFLVCGAVAGLAACAEGAEPAGMTVQASTVPAVADASPVKNAIAVGTVSGGEETNPLWKSEVSNENFKTALEDSLTQSTLKGDGNAPFVMNAKLVSLRQPLMGFDLKVTSTVEYTVLPTGKTAPIMQETVVTPYTANFSDAFGAVKRLRLANEGAMRENIKEMITRLIKAGEPGGPLADPAKRALTQ